MAILIGLSNDESDLEIRENSIIALGDCVEFLQDIFSSEQVRDYASGLLIGCLTHPSEKIRLTALQRSCDYVKAIYPHFGKYVNALLQATSAAISSNDEDIAAPAMEVWSTLANEYIERSHTAQ